MDFEEFKKLCEEMKAQGMTDEDLLKTILKLYTDGEIEIEDMKKMAGTLGYELSDKFLSEQEGVAPAAPEAEGITEEEIEDAKEFKPGEEEESEESSEEEKEESESGDAEEEEESEEETEDSEDEEEESEEDEKEKAMKMFR